MVTVQAASSSGMIWPLAAVPKRVGPRFVLLAGLCVCMTLVRLVKSFGMA